MQFDFDKNPEFQTPIHKEFNEAQIEQNFEATGEHSLNLFHPQRISEDE